MKKLGLLIVSLLLAACGLATEPLGPRDCECELMDEWAARLPITAIGDTLGIDNVNTGEGADGFGVSGSRDKPAGFDRRIIEETLTGAGFNTRVDADREDSWNAAFFPGASQGEAPWSIEFTETEDGVGLQVSVTVDGSPWGLETIEDLWASYEEDHDAALQTQVERQREAIEILQPLEAALKKLPISSEG